MEKRKDKILNRKLLGSIALLLGLLLLVFPYVQGAYNEWAHPVEKVDPAKEAEEGEPQTKPPEAEKKLFRPSPGRLVIPSINLDVQVQYGITEQILKEGPGFYPQSVHPLTGNVSIAGHRNAYGSPFWHLNELKPGDKIELYHDGGSYFYEVDRVFVVDERDWSVVKQTDRPALTLTTCHPLRPVNGKYDRLIVRAYLYEPVPPQ